MNRIRTLDGFFLLDAVMAITIISVFIISILLFIPGASSSVIRTKKKAEKIIQERNNNAALVYKNTR